AVAFPLGGAVPARRLTTDRSRRADRCVPGASPRGRHVDRRSTSATRFLGGRRGWRRWVVRCSRLPQPPGRGHATPPRLRPTRLAYHEAQWPSYTSGPSVVSQKSGDKTGGAKGSDPHDHSMTFKTAGSIGFSRNHTFHAVGRHVRRRPESGQQAELG